MGEWNVFFSDLFFKYKIFDISVNFACVGAEKTTCRNISWQIIYTPVNLLNLSENLL